MVYLLTARTKRQANTIVCIQATGDLRINDVMPNVDIILDALLRLKREEIELGEAASSWCSSRPQCTGVYRPVSTRPASR